MGLHVVHPNLLATCGALHRANSWEVGGKVHVALDRPNAMVNGRPLGVSAASGDSASLLNQQLGR